MDEATYGCGAVALGMYQRTKPLTSSVSFPVLFSGQVVVAFVGFLGIKLGVRKKHTGLIELSQLNEVRVQ